jgi:GAF domain-containing protein
VELLQRLVDQLGAALESAQLFQETQRRAAREQAIRQITERMRSAVEVETILQNTVSELARALGVPRAYVRLGTEAELLSSRRTEAGDGNSQPDGDTVGNGMESEE